jgi:exodeoxyribonuclease VII small subunit
VSASKPDEEPLDRRLDRLEEIVDSLDRPDLELEDAMRLFEEGVAHLRAARELLRVTELRVERLLDDGTGAAFTERTEEGS